MSNKPAQPLPPLEIRKATPSRVRAVVLRRFDSPHLRYTVHPARLSADDSLLHGAVCLCLREIFAGPKLWQR
jgi:hypothetical protein